jgi:hypothetical protein
MRILYRRIHAAVESNRNATRIPPTTDALASFTQLSPGLANPNPGPDRRHKVMDSVLVHMHHTRDLRPQSSILAISFAKARNIPLARL